MEPHADIRARFVAADLTASQLYAIDIVERVGSTFSLLGCGFIIISFLCSSAFHKPINRLVFYASIGNIMTNIATLIARSSLGDIKSGICQFQAFLIQMFMPADAYWTLAMACNVYLTFYWKFDAEKLRKMEIFYLIICYGVPFVPAFVYIFTKTASKGSVYGNATLWCWVSTDWDIWRIITFYGPVWVVILVTIIIYLRTGMEIYSKRKQLRSFSNSAPEPSPMLSGDFANIKTTEIFITSDPIDPQSADSIDLNRLDRHAKFPRGQQAANNNGNGYSITISSSQQDGQFSGGEKSLPSSPNTAPVTFEPSLAQPDRAPVAQTRRMAMEANNAAWAYAKVALLFFTAMLVTWIPSSANRVYSVVHPGQISLPLEIGSATVLPLQGFWNALIYITTSRQACKSLWRDLTNSRIASSRPSIRGVFSSNSKERLPSRGGKGSLETESMTELANRRPSTKGSAV